MQGRPRGTIRESVGGELGGRGMEWDGVEEGEWERTQRSGRVWCGCEEGWGTLVDVNGRIENLHPFSKIIPIPMVMDSLNFDGYTSYSDSSTPRTPSPEDMHFPHTDNTNFKDTDHPVRNIFSEEDSVAVAVPPNENTYWQPQSSANSNPNPFAFNNNNSRGSLLQELYEHEIPEHQSLTPEYQPNSDSPFQPSENNWSQQEHHRSTEYPMMRRATFPYVRHDRDDGMPMQQYPPFMQHQQHPHHQQQQQQQHHNHHTHHQQQQQQHHHNHHNDNLLHHYSRQEALYGEPHPLDGAHGETFIPSMSSSPHSSYHDFDDGANIKLEDNTPIMVPSQTSFYRPPSSSGCHPMTMSYLSPHTGLPVQHTDDAASKETQYLRRRCFNCHTTEPPSWRRSTLNPGKIVCNKCGLYERTHLRPRPLRFDELRAGNKARKQSKATTSPKQAKMGMVKKEPREFGLVRRSSVSSNSSVHSGSGASDWDDNGVLHNKTAFPQASPIVQAFPLSRDQSLSPPRDGGIRLPNNPLSDIATMHITQQQQQQQSTTTPLLQASVPRKSHTSPGYFSPSLAASPAPQSQQHQEYFSQQQQQQQLNGASEPTWAPEPVENKSGLVSSPSASSS
ncbi:hypothetical protein B0H34DRAFT_831975 [Crassisporium funariophilum]|nr:hypothetical protein B0H34DRAFT_831975 [Crassisporium funariophilum]